MGMDFPIHWLIILLVVVLLFGGKKIPEVMRGLGEGIRSFKSGMHGHATTTEVTNPPAAPPAVVTPTPTATEEKK
jgi:sec-independent protein translocase protein TatA